jgi:hypothetical protein
MSSIVDWYHAWLREQQALSASAAKQQYKLPSDIVKALREAAMDFEDSERDPRTGISTFLKEETVEWAAADLIEERFVEIKKFEELRDQFVEIWLDLGELLGMDKPNGENNGKD